MESQNIETSGIGKKILLNEYFKVGLSIVICLIVMWALWLLFNSERENKDKQIANQLSSMKNDIEDLKKDNKECNEFTKSILLKEIQESNSLQKDLRDWLDRRYNQ
jgi:hypothetical protein